MVLGHCPTLQFWPRSAPAYIIIDDYFETFAALEFTWLFQDRTSRPVKMKDERKSEKKNKKQKSEQKPQENKEKNINNNQPKQKNKQQNGKTSHKQTEKRQKKTGK